jgi:peptide/nickel transport system permease protein
VARPDAALQPLGVGIPSSKPSSWRAVRAAVARASSSPVITIAGLVLLVHVCVVVFGPALARYPGTEFHMTHRLEPPSASFWFGTDQFGRDVFSRIVLGARGTLLLAVVSTLLGVALGVVVGLFTAYLGGLVDEVSMRVMDALMSLPALLLAMLILSTLGSNRLNVMLGIALVFVPRAARIVRSAALGVVGLGFVDAARARGESAGYIVLHELLPNMWTPIIVEVSIRLSYAILLATSLGFLGLGVQPPEPDWGLMTNEARNYFQSAPWLVFFPSAAISTAVIGTNLFADGFGRLFGLEGGREAL